MTSAHDSLRLSVLGVQRHACAVRNRVPASRRFSAGRSRPALSAAASGTGLTGTTPCSRMRSALARSCSQFGNHMAIEGKINTSATQIT